LSPREPERSERVFAEPWQAQAFALAVELSEAGHFTWAEWTETLAAEIKAAGAGPEGGGERYYELWLAALERLVAVKGLAEPKALAARREAWERAYRATPHGKPVELGAGEGRAR
jgi:nitrile hydratase accessory protein